MKQGERGASIIPPCLVNSDLPRIVLPPPWQTIEYPWRGEHTEASLHLTCGNLSLMRLLLLASGLVLLLTSTALATPPATYDLRTAGPGGASWITPVKSQGKLSTCWSFSTAAAFESSLLRQGIVTDPNSPLVNLSEWHDATHNGFNHPDYDYPYNAKGTGGAQRYTVAYYTRGQGVWNVDPATGPQVAGGGPVLESQNPLNVYPTSEMEQKWNLLPYVPPADQKPAYALDRAEFLWWDGLVPGQPILPLAQQLDRMKNAVIDHGALSVAMYYTAASYDEATHTYYFSGPSTTETDHLVTVAGWDDNQVVPGAPEPGAWLIQNSWGTEFGDQGYFWVSYQDALINKFPATLIAGDLPAGSQVWQNQIMYPADHTGLAKGTVSEAAAIIEVGANTVVESLGIYAAYAAQQVEINIYDRWEAGGPADLLTSFSHIFDLPGYALVDLPFALPRTTDGNLVVTVDYGSENAMPVPYETVAGAALGRSYLLNDQGIWEDMATSMNPGVFAVKVVTIPEPSALLLAGLAALGLGAARSRPKLQAYCP
jgi:hypothetical protein